MLGQAPVQKSKPVRSVLSERSTGPAPGTTFLVDPKQKLIAIMMIQVPLGLPGAEFRHTVRSLAYQALTSN